MRTYRAVEDLSDVQELDNVHANIEQRASHYRDVILLTSIFIALVATKD